jgi:geranylgeranyl reductase family protein
VESAGLASVVWDVIVVGAGPAGCAAAASVRQQAPDASVLVIDRAQFPRDKACGDGIAFEAGQLLERLGFDLPAIFDGAPPVRTLALRSPSGAQATRQMAHPVRVIPRVVLDDRLVRDIRSRGIEVRQHELRSLDAGADLVTIDSALRARVVIGADGAESVVRRLVGIRPASGARVALAIRGYAPELPDQGGAQIITMTGRNWPAYAWSFPIGDGTANVGYGQLLGSDRSGAPRPPLTRAQMLDRMRDLLPGVGPAERLRAHRLPMSSGRPPIANGRVLLVGDAQSLINPLTGEGIFYAVASGELAGAAAARALAAGVDAGRAYRRLIRARLGAHFAQTTAMARLGQSPRLIDAGVRAAAADQRAFDDLVRFGLADGHVTARLLSRLRFQGFQRF